MDNHSVRREIKKDMKAYIEESGITVITGQHKGVETWFVTPHNILFSKEQIRLNRALGLHKINK